MSQDGNQMDSSEARTENDSWNLRSPCLDAHHEAFILRSSWTVGNLYAANLHLGQSYVKQIKDLEKQRKVWLSRKEKEQEKMLSRWKDLEKQARKSQRSDGLEVKDGRRPESPAVRKFRQRASTLGTSSQIAGVEKFGPREGIEHLNIYKPASHPTKSGLIVAVPTKEYSAHYQYGFQKYEKLPRTQSLPSARSMYSAFALDSRSGQTLRRTVSGLPSSIKSSRYLATDAERENLTMNNHLIPKWLPSNLRLKHVRDNSLA